ncbi:hypothetical protein Y032_0021g442 [Ancylostoma ceylanicum]|nr:hypothetical protein Y032_0021g442 [Ancylostoma ceylanicum]
MDCIQLVIHSMIGSVLAFELSVPSYITTLGAFMGATWMLMVTTTVLLTIHRLVWTIWPMYAKKILSPRASKALLVGLATFYLLFLIWNLTPYSALVFNKKYMAWYYDPAYPMAWICSTMDTISNYATGIVTTLIYAVIFGFLFRRRANWRKNREVRVTLLVFCFCAYQIVCFVIWEFIFPMLENKLYLSCINLVLWVIWNGASALLYMIFSVSFRRDLMNMIRSIGWDRGEQKCNRVIPIAAIQNLPKAAA